MLDVVICQMHIQFYSTLPVCDFIFYWFVVFCCRLQVSFLSKYNHIVMVDWMCQRTVTVHDRLQNKLGGLICA